jgi:hypothetical protein
MQLTFVTAGPGGRAVPLAARTDAVVARTEDLAGQIDAARPGDLWDRLTLDRVLDAGLA